MMQSARLNAFAEVTRMTTADADALTLRSYADRYPALAQALVRPGSIPRPRRLSQPWLLMNHSRYCPACLAGDGTPIQASHGGPWKRQWRLAITFACLDHWTFLRSECPRCRQPALCGRSGGPLTLLPAANAPRLHPAQCRNWSGKREVCGHRLDGAEPAAAALTPELADLQTVLLDLLDGDEPAELASQRFADLQVAISLIQAGWPVAAELAPAATRAVLEAHLAPQQQDGPGPGPATESAGSPPETVWSAPPGDSVATAGLLFGAYHLLAQDSSDPRSALPQLLRNLPTLDDLRWGRTWPMLAHQASPSLRRRIDQVYRHRLSADWIRQGAPTLRASKANTTQKVFAPTHTLTDLGIAPEYIPQCLPGSWLLAATLMDSERDLTSYRLRRVLPVHLVQVISDMNFLEAAAFLGIPTSWTTQSRLRVKPLDPRRDLKNGDLPATLRLLAQHVLGQEKVDYRARRMQFSRWSIDDMAWGRALPTTSSRPRPEAERAHPRVRIRLRLELHHGKRIRPRASLPATDAAPRPNTLARHAAPDEAQTLGIERTARPRLLALHGPRGTRQTGDRHHQSRIVINTDPGPPTIALKIRQPAPSTCRRPAPKRASPTNYDPRSHT
ncbi:TniQ family protein [Streptomyces sp. NBC_01207]|nr:TniQ family protein [Streptomyces sp. NBC_01207]